MGKEGRENREESMESPLQQVQWPQNASVAGLQQTTDGVEEWSSGWAEARVFKLLSKVKDIGFVLGAMGVAGSFQAEE
jgi:hypothetical protein